MEDENKSFLGTGWSFPPTFLNKPHDLKLVKEDEDIMQSLFILLATIPGERIMRPTYGCDLHRMVFDRLNNTSRHRIIDLVTMAILRHEPRVSVAEIEVHMTDEYIGLIHIVVHFTIRKTNVRSNIVYPFYFKEGTNIRDM